MPRLSRIRFVRCLLTATLFATAVFSGTTSGSTSVTAADPLPIPELIADLNQLGNDSSPGVPVRLDDLVLFRASDVEHGSELWKHDLSTGDTELVADLTPGPDGSSPAFLTEVGGTAYFTIVSAANRYEVWVTDGTTAGTTRVGNVDFETSGSGRPRELVAFDGELYFRADDGSTGTELWRTGGPNGLELVGEINPTGSADLRSLTVVPVDPTLDALYFRADDGTNGLELFRYDSKYGFTQFDLVSGAIGSDPGVFAVVDDVLYLRATTAGVDELWRVTGADVAAVVTTVFALPKDVYDIEASAGRVFVTIRDSGVLRDLYVVDSPSGSPVLLGTDMLANSMAGIGTGILFEGEGANGHELWFSGGTIGTTGELADLDPGSADSNPQQFAVDEANKLALFSASTAAGGRQLWRTDGTSGGTYQLTDQAASGPSLWFVGGGRWMVELDDRGKFGNEPWISDSTVSGTKLMHDINTSTEDSHADEFARLGDAEVLFVADDAVHGYELWRTDGDSVSVIDKVPGSDGIDADALLSLGDLVIFKASDPTAGFEPWVTDGTVAGTQLLADIEPGLPSPTDFFMEAAAGSTGFFRANGGLWATEGVPGDPVKVFDGPATRITAVGDRLFFDGDTPGAGREPWVSDGTLVGTVPLGDLSSGTGSSHPRGFTEFDGVVYFRAMGQLWSTNGNSGDATSVTVPAGVSVNLVASSSTTLMIGDENASGSDPIAYSTGDVSQGFAPVVFDGIQPPEIWVDNPARLGDRIVVAANDSRPGFDNDALAFVEGTTGDVVTFAEPGVGLEPYLASEPLFEHRGYVYFMTEDDDDYRVRLWRSDGTTTGTEVVTNSDPLVSNPRMGDLAMAGTRLFYFAEDSAVGQEPYMLELGPLAPSTPRSVSAVPGDGEVVVAWAAPSSDGGDSIVSYVATAEPGGKTCTTGGALSCTVTGLTNGTTYSFTVTAANGYKVSLPSAKATATPEEPGSGFLPLTPARLFESRVGEVTVDGLQAGGGRVAAGSVTEVMVAGRGGVPGDAGAVSLNVTAVGPDGFGFLTVFPCGVDVPKASNVNFGPGDVAPNAVLSKVGVGGKVCVFTKAGTDLIVDVNGAFE